MAKGTSHSRDANLIMTGREVAELYLGVGCDLSGLLVGLKISYIDRKSIHPYWRYRSEARLIAINGGQHREFGLLDGLPCQVWELLGVEWVRMGLGHQVRASLPPCYL